MNAAGPDLFDIGGTNDTVFSGQINGLLGLHRDFERFERKSSSEPRESLRILPDHPQPDPGLGRQRRSCRLEH